MTADQRRSPLVGVPPHDTGRLRITEMPFVPKVNVRASGAGARDAATALGASLPDAPNTVTRTGEVVALWLGPDEWLVLGGVPDPLPAGDYGLVDVSAQYTTIVLTGPAVLEVLAHGCALDLERAEPGWCAQTMLALASVIMWGAGPDEVHVLVRASFARYLAAWLRDAAAEIR